MTQMRPFARSPPAPSAGKTWRSSASIWKRCSFRWYEKERRDAKLPETGDAAHPARPALRLSGGRRADWLLSALHDDLWLTATAARRALHAGGADDRHVGVWWHVGLPARHGAAHRLRAQQWLAAQSAAPAHLTAGDAGSAPARRDPLRPTSDLAGLRYGDHRAWCHTQRRDMAHHDRADLGRCVAVRAVGHRDWLCDECGSILRRHLRPLHGACGAGRLVGSAGAVSRAVTNHRQGAAFLSGGGAGLACREWPGGHTDECHDAHHLDTHLRAACHPARRPTLAPAHSLKLPASGVSDGAMALAARRGACTVSATAH